VNVCIRLDHRALITFDYVIDKRYIRNAKYAYTCISEAHGDCFYKGLLGFVFSYAKRY